MEEDASWMPVNEQWKSSALNNDTDAPVSTKNENETVPMETAMHSSVS